MANLTSTATAFVMMLTLTAAVNAGSVLFVDDDAPPGGDGTSWKTAFSDLQLALDEAIDSPDVTEIRVGRGTYIPSALAASPDARSATFQMINGVAIRGGYAGFGAGDPDDRDIELYETILSGDIELGDCCFVHDDPGCSQTDCAEQVCSVYPPCCETEWDENCVGLIDLLCPGLCPDRLDPAYHVATGSGTDETAVLDGFTITGGDAFGAPTPQEKVGGGMYIIQGSPTVSNCLFVANNAELGGGMHTANAEATVANCVFRDNFASRGGAMYNLNSNPTIIDCTFNNNSTDLFGGAVYNFGSEGEFVRCAFDGNLALGAGAGMYNDASFPMVIECTFTENEVVFAAEATGGAGMYNFSSSPIVVNCAFVKNVFSGEKGGGQSTFWGGGGMFNYNGSNPILISCLFEANVAGVKGSPLARGGGMIAWIDSSPTLIGCSFHSNRTTGWGGGVMFSGGSPVLVNCEFLQNTVAFQAGGAMYLSGTSATVTDCRFLRNEAKAGGALVHSFDDASFFTNCAFIGNQSHVAGGGAVVCWNASMPTFDNCTFIANRAMALDGGAVASWAEGSDPTLTNCTLVGNVAVGSGGGLFVGNGPGLGSRATVSNCILWNNIDENGGGESAQIFIDDSSPFYTASVNYSCIEGLTGKLGGIGNIGDDPLFVDPDGDDNIPGNEDDDLRLQPGSPAIDAGNNWGVPIDENDYDEDGLLCELFPVDLDGNPRFNADEADFDPGCGVPVVVDMGAYEYQFEPVDQLTFADLNGDGVVGAADLLGLLVSWGPCAKGCCLADLDIDGSVGATDLLALLVNWGPCP